MEVAIRTHVGLVRSRNQDWTHADADLGVVVLADGMGGHRGGEVASRTAVKAVIDEPGGKEYYGGQVAAPLFAEVTAGALRMLGISPDDLGGMGHRVAVSARQRLAMRDL